MQMRYAFLGENHNDMFHSRVHYKNYKVDNQNDQEVQRALSPFPPIPLDKQKEVRACMDKWWEIAFKIFVVVKTIEYLYKLYKWIKNKKNKDS